MTGTDWVQLGILFVCFYVWWKIGREYEHMRFRRVFMDVADAIEQVDESEYDDRYKAGARDLAAALVESVERRL